MHEENLWADPKTWVVVAFVLFFVFFGRKLWQAMAKILDSRTEAVRESLAEASRLRQEAEAMLRDAEARRAAAVEDARRLVEGAQAQAASVAAAAAADAETASRRREQMAIDRIAAAEKAALDEVRLTAAEVATTAARQVLASGLSAEADAKLIDHAIDQLPAALASRRAA
jgi:F-type H+-transporting ATPase subunit b